MVKKRWYPLDLKGGFLQNFWQTTEPEFDLSNFFAHVKESIQKDIRYGNHTLI